MEYVIAYVISVIAVSIGIQLYKGVNKDFDKFMATEDWGFHIFASAIWPMILVAVPFVIGSQWVAQKIYSLGLYFRKTK